MYENFYFLGISSLFLYCFFKEGERIDKPDNYMRTVYFFAGFIFLFGSLFYNFDLTQTIVTTNGNTATTNYVYSVQDNLLGVGSGFVALFYIIAGLWAYRLIKEFNNFINVNTNNRGKKYAKKVETLNNRF